MPNLRVDYEQHSELGKNVGPGASLTCMVGLPSYPRATLGKLLNLSRPVSSFLKWVGGDGTYLLRLCKH